MMAFSPEWMQFILVLVADACFLAVMYGYIRSKMAQYDRHLEEADDVRELLVRLDERVKTLQDDIRRLAP